jgi:hypothetical protein
MQRNRKERASFARVFGERLPVSVVGLPGCRRRGLEHPASEPFPSLRFVVNPGEHASYGDGLPAFWQNRRWVADTGGTCVLWRR